MNKKLKVFLKNIFLLIIFFAVVFFMKDSFLPVQKIEEEVVIPYDFHHFEEKLQRQLEDEYEAYITKPEVKELIISLLKKQYQIKAIKDDITYDYLNQTYHYRKNNCDIEIYFNSSLEMLTSSMSAYFLATDTVLVDPTMSLQQTNDYQTYINASEYLKSSNWLKMDENFKHYRLFVNKGFRNQLIVVDQQDFNYLNLSKEPFNDGTLIGKIEIPLYYDLSDYRKDDIIGFYQSESYKQKYANIETISLRQRELYWSYFDIVGKKDPRGDIFFPLRNQGVIMYIPVSGLNANFAYGKTAESGDIGILEPLQNKTKWQIWSEISRLDEAGLCSTRSYIGQCTSFANYWFYLQHGYDPLMGDGCHMAAALVRDLPDLFEDGCFAAAGGIVSIGSANKANHVLCVDAVDYDKGIIIISEANTGGYANIKLRVEYSFDEFEAYCRHICEVMCDGNMDGFYINYANPIKK